MSRHPKAGEVIDVLAGHLLRSKVCSSQIERILLTQDAENFLDEGERAPQETVRENSPVVQVSLVELAHTQPLLVEQVVRKPMLLLKHFERACMVSQHYMHSKHPRRSEMKVKQNVKVRVYGIPGSRTMDADDGLHHGRVLVSPSVSEIRACMANRLICVSGTITKVGSPHLVEYKQQYECNRCHTRFEVDIDVHAGGHVQLPEVCPNGTSRKRRKKKSNSGGGGQQQQLPQNQFQSNSSSQPSEASGASQGSLPGSQQAGCQGTNFTLCEENRYHKDCQEIKLQEWSRQIKTGGSVSTTGRDSASGGGKHNPKSITVRLEDELVDRFRPGDEVQVTGVLVQHWRKIGKPDQTCEVELLINGVHVVALSTARAGSRATKRDATLALGMAPPPASSSSLQPHGQEEDEDWVQAHWRRHAETPLAGRDVIVGSLSPQVHGLYTAKLAVMLVLCGGVALRGAATSSGGSNASHQRSRGGFKARDREQGDQNGNHSVRGECHLLLAGDPGTGKSQLMRCAARLTHRSVVTNGRGSTNAGLTATAVISKGERAMSAGGAGGKSGKMKGGKGSEWTLEAGALVLADGGICCIDEFETMRESDRAAIHEAMEQQTLSIAKAGLVTKLRAQTAIIASTNIRKPKKASADYDPFATGFDESMVRISAPLLSRFDLVLTVRDLSWKEWDTVIADHVLDQHMSKGSGSVREGSARGSAEVKRDAETWTQERMKEYIARVRKLTPVMTKDAEEVLKLYYQKQRQLSASESHNRPSARTTLRMLESLVRLSQAHARLMCREQVRLQDAVASVALMEASMKHGLILGVQNVTQSVAPRDPDAEGQRAEELVLRALGLGHDGTAVTKRRFITAPSHGRTASHISDSQTSDTFGGQSPSQTPQRKALWGDNYKTWTKENTRPSSNRL